MIIEYNFKKIKCNSNKIAVCIFVKMHKNDWVFYSIVTKKTDK